MDIQSGFWQIEVAPESLEKTAYPKTKTTPKGLWQFKKIGLCNAPATFHGRRVLQVIRQTRQ